MDLIFLDKRFNVIKFVEYINLQWNRRYYECGQYSVQILAKDYENSFLYVYRNSEAELGIVQKVEHISEERGEFVQISGFFLESALNNYILHPTFSFNGSVKDCISTMLSIYCDDIPNFNVDVSQAPTTSISFQKTGEEIASQMFSILQKYEYSFSLSYDYIHNGIDFRVWSGSDRTSEVAPILGHETAIFNQNWGHFKNLIVTTDDSNYKNYAVVAGSGEGDQRQIVLVDESNGEKLKRLYVDARDLQQQEDMSHQQYLDALKERGKEYLNKHKNILNIDFDFIGDMEYKENFDLGDKCDIVLKNTDEVYQSRIIGVDELIKENRKEIKLQFGDKIPRKR